jgi:hypothetical protein
MEGSGGIQNKPLGKGEQFATPQFREISRKGSSVFPMTMAAPGRYFCTFSLDSSGMVVMNY